MPQFIHGATYSSLSATDNSLTPLQSFLLKNYEADIHSFISDDPAYFHSPFLLPDMLPSIGAINRAVQNKKHILLYGDRDTDGVSSTSLLAIFFRNLHELSGGRLTVKTSSQSDDYGLCETAVKNVLAIKPDLLITLDFGSTNYDEINDLAKNGIEVIVLDHHEMPTKIPKCFLINPKREDSIYPEKRICTSFLALKLIQALTIYNTYNDNSIDYSQLSLATIFQRYPEIKKLTTDLCDLASIGTITDMMPLIGENRLLVKNGLKTLSEISGSYRKDRKGLSTLIQGLKLNPKKIVSKDLGWSIGPALNAAGRMGKTEVALKLLLETDDALAFQTAQQLIALNTERKERTKRNLFKVEKYFERKKERKDKKVIFCYEPDLEPGVSGIVATKLVQEYQKPVVFVTPDNGNARGSVRSFGKENIIDLFSLLDDLFIHSGGHPEAGGFSIAMEKIPLLEKKLEEVAEQWLNLYSSETSLETIESVVSFNPDQLKGSYLSEFSILEPFGMENRQPLISVRNAVVINFKPMGDGTHARFSLLGSSNEVKCVIWGRAKELEAFLSKNQTIDLWGKLEENYFNGSTSVQFIIEYFA
jgi:single-stranded-DNA-specific exonuclease